MPRRLFEDEDQALQEFARRIDAELRVVEGLTAQRDDLVRALFRDRAQVTQIADAIGMSKNVVYRIVNEDPENRRNGDGS